MRPVHARRLLETDDSVYSTEETYLDVHPITCRTNNAAKKMEGRPGFAAGKHYPLHALLAWRPSAPVG